MEHHEKQKEAAVKTHSDQASQFEQRYEGKGRDPYSNCFVYSRKRLQAWLDRALAANGTGQKLLDVGCGTGHQLRELEARGFQVAGVDGSEEMLKVARRINPGVDLRTADVEALPYAKESFNWVLSIEVLRYLPDFRLTVREMGRVLAPGGTAVVTACPRFSLNAYALVNRLSASGRLAGLTPLRQYFVTAGELSEGFRDAGFDLVEVHGVYLGPINWVERLARPLLRPTLRAWEPVDSWLADAGPLRELSNMFLVIARKAR
ncbi:MAG: methyltransferase domain-containing protein [Fimbriimonadaceae bacterium]|nr:methyltransferase domain-containing protein [Fimbriimonadaceae bacterium]